jgi:UrcA family protein
MKTVIRGRAAAGLSHVSKPVIMCAVVLATYSASAVNADEIKVRYDDLNLSHPMGVQVLKHRIQRAAQYVCGLNDTRDLERMWLYRECIREAADRALAQVSWQGEP